MTDLSEKLRPSLQQTTLDQAPYAEGDQLAIHHINGHSRWLAIYSGRLSPMTIKLSLGPMQGVYTMHMFGTNAGKFREKKMRDWSVDHETLDRLRVSR